MLLKWLAFAVLAALALASALGVVTARRVVRAALYLALTLATTVGIYLLLYADFVALVQLLVYAGAVTIVVLFALMLTRREEEGLLLTNSQWPFAVAGAVVVLGALLWGVLGTRWVPVGNADQRIGLSEIGRAIFDQWVVPFEIASLLLLVALLGAIIIAGSDEGEP